MFLKLVVLKRWYLDQQQQCHLGTGYRPEDSRPLKAPRRRNTVMSQSHCGGGGGPARAGRDSLSDEEATGLRPMNEKEPATW